MSWRPFAACATVALVGLAVGFVAGRASKTDQVVTRLIPASQDARRVEQLTPETVLTDIGISRVPIVESAPPAVVEQREPTFEEALGALDRALRHRPIGEGTDAEFERKYQNVSLPAAREAMLLLAARVEEERASVAKAREAAGQFEERRAGDERDPPHVHGSGGPGSSSMVGLGHTIAADGSVVKRFTTFHSKDYPALLDAELELLYLQSRMRISPKTIARSSK